MANQDSAAASACKIVLFIISILFVPLLKGWIVSVMWGWFVVPTFGLPPLTAIQGVGIFLIATLFRKEAFSYDQEDDPPLRNMATETAQSIVSPLFIAGVGWVFHLLI